MSNHAYALKHEHQDGLKFIQEFDSLEEALIFQADNCGVLVRREQIAGQPGLWWVETNPTAMDE